MAHAPLLPRGPRHSVTLSRASPPGEAVFARCLSSLKDERVQASKRLKGPPKAQFGGDKKSFLEDIRKVGLVCSSLSVMQRGGQVPPAAPESQCRCRPRPSTRPRSSPTPRASCCSGRPPPSSAGRSTMAPSPSCGGAAASSAGVWARAATGYVSLCLASPMSSNVGLEMRQQPHLPAPGLCSVRSAAQRLPVWHVRHSVPGWRPGQDGLQQAVCGHRPCLSQACRALHDPRT